MHLGENRKGARERQDCNSKDDRKLALLSQAAPEPGSSVAYRNSKAAPWTAAVGSSTVLPWQSDSQDWGRQCVLKWLRIGGYEWISHDRRRRESESSDHQRRAVRSQHQCHPWKYSPRCNYAPWWLELTTYKRKEFFKKIEGGWQEGWSSKHVLNDD